MVNPSNNPGYARAGYGVGVDQAAFDAGLRQHMLNVYNYMASGLALSGIVALALYLSPAFAEIFLAKKTLANGRTIMSFTGLGWVAMLAPIGILFFWMFRGATMSVGTAKILYWAFVALQGVGLSVLLFRYTGASVAQAFFVTAAAFASLSLYGYTTKRDLSGMGKFLFMGLVGLIVAGIVNIFLGSSMLAFIVSVVGLLIFAGLTVYDTQRIKEEYSEHYGSDVQEKIAIFGALGLYLNFINMFQIIMSFLGQERE